MYYFILHSKLLYGKPCRVVKLWNDIKKDQIDKEPLTYSIRRDNNSFFRQNCMTGVLNWKFQLGLALGIEIKTVKNHGIKMYRILILAYESFMKSFHLSMSYEALYKHCITPKITLLFPNKWYYVDVDIIYVESEVGANFSCCYILGIRCDLFLVVLKGEQFSASPLNPRKNVLTTSYITASRTVKW